MGGFLLAFPAILPAALILLERSENDQVQGARRGARDRRAATGAATGSLGLILFAVVAWQSLGLVPTWLVLVAATLTWAAVAVAAWLGRKRLGRLRG